MEGPPWSGIKRYKENYESHRRTRQPGPSYSNSYLNQTLHHCNHWFQVFKLLFHCSLYIMWSMHRIKNKHQLVPVYASAIILQKWLIHFQASCSFLKLHNFPVHGKPEFHKLHPSKKPPNHYQSDFNFLLVLALIPTKINEMAIFVKYPIYRMCI